MKSIRFDFSDNYSYEPLTQIAITLSDGSTSGLLSAIAGGDNRFSKTYDQKERKITKVGVARYDSYGITGIYLYDKYGALLYSYYR